jgi:protein TonB
MFDYLVETRRTRSTARKAASLPVAVVLHGLLVLTFMAYSAYAREVLIAPDIPVTLFTAVSPPPPIPVTRAPKPKPEEPSRSPEAKPAPLRPTELLTPVEIPDHIPPPGPAVASREGANIDGAFPLGENGDDGITNTLLPPTGIADLRPNIVRVGETVRAPKLLRQVAPVYPPAAGAMGLAGRVTLEVVIDQRGNVEDARIVRSDNSIFDGAALDAVRKWKFSAPVTNAGQVVKVYHFVTVNFTLDRR